MSSDKLTLQQKVTALMALSGNLQIHCRAADDWFAYQPDVHIRERGACVYVGTMGNGATPEAAILDYWREIVTELDPTWAIMVANYYADEGKPDRRYVRWNDFMWAEQRSFP